MSKLNLSQVPNGVSNTVTNINFGKIEKELNENVLKRRTEAGEDNTVHTDIDMNSNRIYNLPKPESEHEPLRRKDVLDAISATEDARDAANKANDAVDRVDNMEENFQNFLLNSGYQDLGDYEAGLEITARNQIFRKDGELYRAGAVLELPYTTTGDWSTEGDLFVSVGDAVLRQDLANPDKGAAMVARAVVYAESVEEVESKSLPVGTAVFLTEEGRAGEFVVKAGTPPSDPMKGIYIVLGSDTYAERIHSGVLNVQWFGARGDGIHDDSPHIQAALDLYIEMDEWTGIRLFFPAGVYNLVTPLNPYKPTLYDSFGNVSTTNTSVSGGVQPSVTFESAGRSSVVLVTTGSALAPESDVGVSDSWYTSMNSFFFKGIVFKGREGAPYPIEFDGANITIHKMVFDDCNFTGYEYGFYLNRTGWVNNTNGHAFLGFNNCNFLGNVYGALVGVDNVLFNDCYITYNKRDGLILTEGYNVRLENGKIEYNGYEDSTIYSQIVLQVGASDCSFNSVYMEPTRAGLNNAGHKMIRLIPNPILPNSTYISNLSFIGCYINGGLSTRLMEVASGVNLEGFSITDCYVANFGLGPDNLLIENHGTIRGFSSRGGRYTNIVPSGGTADSRNTGWEFLSSYPTSWSKDTSTIVASSEVEASSLPPGVRSSRAVRFGDGTAITYHTIELDMGGQASVEFNPVSGLDLGVLYKDRNYSVTVQDVTSIDEALRRQAAFGIYRYDTSTSSRIRLTVNMENASANVGVLVLSVQTVGRWR